jgi:hypothetical protein
VYKEAVHGFIGRKRELLGHPTILTMADRNSLERLLLPYLYHILEYYRVHRERHVANGQNRGSIAPVCKIKRHFMTIDTTVLKDLLTTVMVEIPAGWVKED